MKTYQVTVNGQVFEVTVEEMAAGAGTIPAAPKVQPVAAPKPAPQPAPQAAPAQKPAAPATKPAAAVPAGGKTIQAPMPGKIMKINFTTGTSVKRGDVLLVLEAMKMENDIMAPSDGTIASINVNPGDSVNTGDTLVVLA